MVPRSSRRKLSCFDPPKPALKPVGQASPETPMKLSDMTI
ncbi:hypothetical protein COLO4_07620 [Corchorus olitorius]|uniref:Uncharacterized protein n=1 Tax=Corchorus olitorius TaxID=93759 RepID=A0A1R3KJ48_9ROSI|nr:hypothetical protein COLO4_07620 [Corchorus olitorius]